ncbi:MAG: S8 family serine peptidase [Candidatus Eremiobacteraeota bacterium]|nr:S8 family serine peptidase [Candidatus Eremiobacteraeota bacterium]
MREQYVVVRRSPQEWRTRSFGLAPASGSDAGADLSVEVHEIDRERAAALTRNDDVVALAPPVPMKLIKPLAVSVTQAAVIGQTAWGVKAVGADTSPFSGAGVVVAILDTGIDAGHAAFAGVEIVEKDFTGSGSGDGIGHGTHCAGTIFGRTTEGTRIGVAPGVNKALIGKVIGGKVESSVGLAEAMKWAVDNGAHVISMSLGIDFPGYVARLIEDGLPPELATSRALEGYRLNVQLFERLVAFLRAQGKFSQGSVIVAAAGNESRRDIDPAFEIGAGPPAIADGVISVAALGQGNGGLVVAPFSNTDAAVSAPGVNVVSAKTGGGLAVLSGTSMATPHVAGVAALWAEKIRTTGPVTNTQLTARLIGSASSDQLQPGVGPFAVGAGLVSAPQK